MLFVLEQSVQAAVARSRSHSNLSNNLDVLARIIFEGKHRLTARRSILTALSRSPVLASHTRAILKAALASVEIDMALQGEVSILARVGANACSTPTTTNEGRCRILEMPLEWIDSAKIQATTLLCENLYDVDVLKIMAPVFRYLDQRLGLPTHVRPRLGGGQTTAAVLNNVASEEELCLCVVDCDRTYPGGNVGGTALSAQPFKDSTQYPLICMLETKGRDLENSLPNAFYEEAYGNDLNHRTTIEALRTLTAKTEHEVRAHLDMKNGFVLKDVLALNRGPERSFWETKLPILADAAAFSLNSSSCYQYEVCSVPSDCKCRILYGNRDNILKRFAEMYARTGPAMIARKLDFSVRDEWLRLGKAVFDWCCSTEKLRS